MAFTSCPAPIASLPPDWICVPVSAYDERSERFWLPQLMCSSLDCRSAFRLTSRFAVMVASPVVLMAAAVRLASRPAWIDSVPAATLATWLMLVPRVVAFAVDVLVLVRFTSRPALSSTWSPWMWPPRLLMSWAACASNVLPASVPVLTMLSPVTTVTLRLAMVPLLVTSPLAWNDTLLPAISVPPPVRSVSLARR
ncbi:hypothetical protein GO307_04862 [Ralstonia solanacearum]|nr:hypothetical protein [Ralstonia solanacearum]